MAHATLHTMDILPQVLVNSVIAGSLYALIALSFNLIYATTRYFDLSLGALATTGGYGVYFGVKVLGVSFLLAVLFSLAVIWCLSFLLYRFAYGPLLVRKATPMTLLIASLGVSIALQSALAIAFSSQFQTITHSLVSKTIKLPGAAVISITQVFILCVALCVALCLAVLMYRTRFGLATRAISDDADVADAVGISSRRIIVGVYVISGMVAAVAGIMTGLDTGIEPTMGFPLLLKGVVACIIGGIGNVWGGVLGAFLLGMVENIAVWQFSGEWKDAIAFVLLIFFLHFKPKGIISSR